MGKLWVIGIIFLVLASTLFVATSNNEDDNAIHYSQTQKVFEKGNFEAMQITIQISNPCKPPSPLFIVSPKKQGSYPVLFFVHGTLIHNYLYSDVFQHVASHGFIVVAPQIYFAEIPEQTYEIERAAKIINWLVSGLNPLLPEGVEPNFNKLVISGHSRGGKTAFALALGIQQTPLQPKIKISGLIGLDPVAGTSIYHRTEPHILTYNPNSLNLSNIPVTVIGTGLGNRSKLIFIPPIFIPPCAPNGVNHLQFYDECKPGKSTTHLVVTKYGHMDMLNDYSYFVSPSLLCVSGWGPKSVMRKTVGGIIVSFMEAYLFGDTTSFDTVLSHPEIAPTELQPVESKFHDKKRQVILGYAQL